MKDFEFYQENYGEVYLQLHDNRTMWKINKEWNDDEYWNYVKYLVNKMENKYKNLTVYCLGRSNRHICVNDTPINRRRYQYLVDCAEKLEQELINYFNSKEE